MIHRLGSFYLFYFAAVSIYIIFLPKVFSQIGYSPVQIGLLFAVSPIMRFAMPFLFLYFIPLTRGAFLVSLGTALIAVAGIYVCAYRFWCLLGLLALLGASISVMLPFVEVLALERVGKRYGIARLYGSVGFMVLGLILGQMTLGLELAMANYFGALVMTALLGVSLASGLPVSTAQHREWQGVRRFSLWAHWPFWTAQFAVQLSFGAFYSFFTIYEMERGFSLGEVTFFWAFGVAAEIGMFVVQSRFLHLPLLSLMRFSIGLTVIRWLILYGFGEEYVMVLASQFIHAFSLALLHTASISYLNRIYTDKQLAQQFYLGISYGLGGFLGSTLAGIFYGEQLFLYAAVVVLAGFGALFWEHPRRMRFSRL